MAAEEAQSCSGNKKQQQQRRVRDERGHQKTSSCSSSSSFVFFLPASCLFFLCFFFSSCFLFLNLGSFFGVPNLSSNGESGHCMCVCVGVIFIFKNLMYYFKLIFLINFFT